jgi:hypothetical protein
MVVQGTPVVQATQVATEQVPLQAIQEELHQLIGLAELDLLAMQATLE